MRIRFSSFDKDWQTCYDRVIHVCDSWYVPGHGVHESDRRAPAPSSAINVAYFNELILPGRAAASLLGDSGEFGSWSARGV